MWTSEALGPGRPATAYMAARASEHLTRLIRRDRLRASHPATRSPPTSDPRAPEQKEPNRFLTDTGESSEHPAHQASRERPTERQTRAHDSQRRQLHHLKPQ